MSKLVRYLASVLPLPLSWRAPIYRWSGMRVGRQVTIDRNLQVTHPHRIRIGDRVTIANGVSILADVTPVHSRLGSQFNVGKSADILIEDDVFIGVKATILPGVHIGRMATVGANSLVMSDVPAYGVVLGVPARLMMQRPQEAEDRPDPAVAAEP
jgi:acetyltransferase-like isoleucine patch superfamily enzyme